MSRRKTQLQGKKIITSVTNNSVVEQRLDVCLSAGNLAWWEMDCKTGKVIFNENKIRMLGYDMQDFRNIDYPAFTTLLHPDDVSPSNQDPLQIKKQVSYSGHKCPSHVSSNKHSIRWCPLQILYCRKTI